MAKFVGAPPGYVGYEEGGLLTEAIRKNPHAVLLLDEIEKAHADIFNALLQVMDYATLTDNNGKKADFRNVILLMTSNAGAREIGRQTIGFEGLPINRDAVYKALERTFSPEFRNRLDGVVNFLGLTEEVVRKIVKRSVADFAAQLLGKKVLLTVTDGCYDWLARKGYSPEFGAREIARLVQDKVKRFFVDEVLFGSLHGGRRRRGRHRKRRRGRPGHPCRFTDFLRPSPSPVEQTTKSGLLAVGGDLSPERLLAAYREGIFPGTATANPSSGGRRTPVSSCSRTNCASRGA